MMNWMARNNIPIGNKNIADHERNMTDITGGVNDGKVESTDVLNNVYDLLGNLQEWTLEAKSTYVRAYRGGWRLAYSFSPGYRGYYSEIAAVDDMGSRGTLCIQD